MRVDLAGRACPLSRAVSEIGDGWTMLILWACFNDVNRFDEIQTRFGVARNILADRLKKLVDRGLLTRQPIMDGAKRCIYVPTQRAEPLRAPLAAIRAWGDMNCPLPDEEAEDLAKNSPPSMRANVYDRAATR